MCLFVCSSAVFIPRVLIYLLALARVQPRLAAQSLQAWLPQQHLFVRHQHLKMSDCFQRVRSGSLPSLLFSFFNSSCLCPSCKLPLSPWGWRRAVSLFPSQTSVSINSCSGHLLLLLGPGFGEEVLCLSGEGRFPCSSGAGRCGMAVAVDSRSPRRVASACCSSGASV